MVEGRNLILEFEELERQMHDKYISAGYEKIVRYIWPIKSPSDAGLGQRIEIVEYKKITE